LRGFCARCGSTLTCEGERSPEVHFHIGTFDDAARFKPTRHIFPEERMPWLNLRACLTMLDSRYPDSILSGRDENW
jgi:hypothetical protein